MKFELSTYPNRFANLALAAEAANYEAKDDVETPLKRLSKRGPKQDTDYEAKDDVQSPHPHSPQT